MIKSVKSKTVNPQNKVKHLKLQIDLINKKFNTLRNLKQDTFINLSRILVKKSFMDFRKLRE